MHNPSISYQLPTFNGLLRHGRSRVQYVRDGDYSLEAQVRSGDYFVTLAMKLDDLAKTSNEMQTKAALEDVVSDLIHLQDSYTIIKNKDSE